VSLPGRWSALHHGIDPVAVPGLLPWLRFVWWLARPLVRIGVPATAVTLAGVVVAVDAVLVASDVPLAAAACVVLALLCDGLDGAVAIVGRGGTALGARADAAADRVTDVLFAVVLWRCGAPWWGSVTVAGLAVAVDAVRRVRRVPAMITVAERPTWAICAVIGCVSASITDAAWPVWTCAAVAAALGLVALLQVTTAARGPSR
jgi:CDP-diacylglycerol--glycerol-3-phosphate 3-phosphatidyltransferase